MIPTFPSLLLIPMPGNEPLASALAAQLGAQLGTIETRRFPDGESYVRHLSSVQGKAVALVCTLDHPNPKVLQLLFAADAAKDLGASNVGLIAPYLSYLRQDRRFEDGEAVTSVTFARAVSRHVDWLVTVDPHLHRYGSLDAVYTIPGLALRSAPLLANWIKENARSPYLVGPDIESEQWVAGVANLVGVPYQILRKERLGDRDVRVSLPDLDAFSGHTPVIVDDIVSSGRTMAAAVLHFTSAGLPAPVCVAVHALLNEAGVLELGRLGARLVSTNTVPHPSSQIDIAPLIGSAIAASSWMAGAHPGKAKPV